VQPKALKQDFPLVELSVKYARECVRGFCVGRGFPTCVVETAELIATELATNAIRHAKAASTCAEFTLFLTLDDGRLDIGVWDYYPSSCPPLPKLADIPLDAQGGRGLALVQSDAGGFTWARMTTGKLVSAWIRVAEEPAFPLPKTPARFS
jgi:anti-sigma regulatory factor (Ser/Thr protein kinase)